MRFWRHRPEGTPEEPRPRVAIVTDSTAMLAADVVARGVTVIPLQVVVDGVAHDEGTPEAGPEAIVAALTGKKAVTTSRAAPAVLAALYASLGVDGYDEIVSVHLSGELSGTVDAARQAAAAVHVPVMVVDSMTAGPALGGAVLAALQVVEGGGSAAEAAAAATAHAEASRSFFYVDSLEYLRRGGRIGTATALLGSALAVKPLLTLADGRVVLHERVRTSARAIARLQELAVETALADGGETALAGGGEAVDGVVVSVAQLASAERAEALAAGLAERLGLEVPVGEIGAVLGAHLGPGALAVVVERAG